MELLSLKWNNHSTTFFTVLDKLRKEEFLTDVYLSCGGKLFAAHQFVLTVCSDYFLSIFKTSEAKTPIVILHGVQEKYLRLLLDYMYIGEINVNRQELSDLISAAKFLQIKGLAVEDDPEQLINRKRSQTPEKKSPISVKQLKTDSRVVVDNTKSNDVPTSQNIPKVKHCSSYLSTSDSDDGMEKLFPVTEIKIEQENTQQSLQKSMGEQIEDPWENTQENEVEAELLGKHDYPEAYEDTMNTSFPDDSVQYDLTGLPGPSQSDMMLDRMMRAQHLPGRRRESSLNTINNQRLEGSEIISQHHLVELQRGPSGGRRRKRCILCAKSKKEKRVTHMCQKCEVGLCINPCFVKYHTEEQL